MKPGAFRVLANADFKKGLARVITPAGQITSAGLVQYTEGDCWLLAYHLAAQLSAPLVALVNPADQHDWHHVTVDLGRERLLDAFGVRTREETRDYWSRRQGEPVAFRELGRIATVTDLLHRLDGDRFISDFVTERDEAISRAAARIVAPFYRAEASTS